MTFLRRLMISTAALLAAANLAVAADLPSVKAPPTLLEPAPASQWAGFYLGADGGANFLTTTTLGFGGLRAGYNWQFDRVVLGVDGEVDWRPNSTHGVTNWTGAATGTQYQANHGQNANFISTLTGRAGYAIGDRFLPFVSGGLALSDQGLNTAVNGLSGPNAGAFGANSLADFRVGWTVGGGFEMR